jgi:transcriptional regulator with XRE-family HTH domain
MTDTRLVEKLIRLIKMRGYSQDAFERLTVLPRNRISKWVRGQGEPSARQLWRMAKALHVTIEFLLDDEIDGVEAPRNDLELAFAMVRRLGPEVAIRRLMLDERQDPESTTDKSDPTSYSHGQHVGGDATADTRRRKGMTG